jgi:hypothetical protein
MKMCGFGAADMGGKVIIYALLSEFGDEGNCPQENQYHSLRLSILLFFSFLVYEQRHIFPFKRAVSV